ncbi:hypothetical protein HZ326_0318 [Fusarium oxysporum f. sp. albedinis]|nr:hypothetical protein HZ326_0318 [Fusarium oxysporum f. sp. albedinis]
MCEAKDVLHHCERCKCHVKSDVQVRRCPQAIAKGIHVCLDARWEPPSDISDSFKQCKACFQLFICWKLRVDTGDHVPRPDPPFPGYEDYGK